MSHLSLSSVSVVAAIVLWIAIFCGEHVAMLATLRWFLLICALVALCVATQQLITPIALYFVVAVCGLSAGAWAWHAVQPVMAGQCAGVVTLRDDPQLSGPATSVIVQLHGRRYRAVAYGMPGRRLAQRLSGQSVWLEGTCQQLQGSFARRDYIKHIVGRIQVTSVSEQFSEGSHFIRAANRIRDVISTGTATMSRERRALFLGLVIGDDRDQSREMIDRFRESGLSHLCAVSGQNVAFLLVLIRPWTSRRHRVVAWVVSVSVIGWFVVVTRAEPSIVRASVMAAIAATITVFGRQPDTRVVLAWTVMALLLIDPMLAWSIGFGLSVGATAGLAWGARWCLQVLGGGQTMSSTLAAQAGTTPLSLLVFGTVPVVSLVANPLAIPIAGVVMTVGLPLAILASVVPSLSVPIGALLAIPVGWVDVVATFAAWVSPAGWLNWLLWGCVVVFLARRVHRQQVAAVPDVAG